MKNSLLKYLAVLMIAITGLGFGSDIEIDIDRDDCLDGWISMDVEIEIDGEEFELSPSCSFSFDEEIKTKSGVTCEIEAGMCSAFSPQGKLEIECSDGRDEEIQIPCPVENFDLDIDVDDKSACKDDPNGSIDIEVEVDFAEDYDFRASCDWSLRESFTTESGDHCTVESSMCGGFSSSARIEVQCDGGARESTSIDCN